MTRRSLIIIGGLVIAAVAAWYLLRSTGSRPKTTRHHSFSQIAIMRTGEKAIEMDAEVIMLPFVAGVNLEAKTGQVSTVLNETAWSIEGVDEDGSLRLREVSEKDFADITEVMTRQNVPRLPPQTSRTFKAEDITRRISSIVLTRNGATTRIDNVNCAIVPIVAAANLKGEAAMLQQKNPFQLEGVDKAGKLVFREMSEKETEQAEQILDQRKPVESVEITRLNGEKVTIVPSAVGYKIVEDKLVVMVRERADDAAPWRTISGEINQPVAEILIIHKDGTQETLKSDGTFKVVEVKDGTLTILELKDKLENFAPEAHGAPKIKQ